MPEKGTNHVEKGFRATGRGGEGRRSQDGSVAKQRGGDPGGGSVEREAKHGGGRSEEIGEGEGHHLGAGVVGVEAVRHVPFGVHVELRFEIDALDAAGGGDGLDVLVEAGGAGSENPMAFDGARVGGEDGDDVVAEAGGDHGVDGVGDALDPVPVDDVVDAVEDDHEAGVVAVDGGLGAGDVFGSEGTADAGVGDGFADHAGEAGGVGGAGAFGTLGDGIAERDDDVDVVVARIRIGDAAAVAAPAAEEEEGEGAGEERRSEGGKFHVGSYLLVQVHVFQTTKNNVGGIPAEIQQKVSAPGPKGEEGTDGGMAEGKAEPSGFSLISLQSGEETAKRESQQSGETRR